MYRHFFLAVMSILVTDALAITPAKGRSDDFASQFVSYNPGTGAGDYTDPLAALGEPARFTGQGIFPAVVSAFNAPWMPDQIVSIGAGGYLIVSFTSPIVDDPMNPHGIDLLIFGNTMFSDVSFPGIGVVDGVFGNDGGIVEVSADGATWHTVPGVLADDLFPTMGYTDAGPYDEVPGSSLTDFTLPVDPTLSFDDFLGLEYEAVLELYNGSGGGNGIDLASVGLEQISFVRVSNPMGAPSAVQVDAFARVKPVMPHMPSDLDHDGSVGVTDLLLLLGDWGACGSSPSCAADLDGDGTVGVADLLLLLADWG